MPTRVTHFSTTAMEREKVLVVEVKKRRRRRREKETKRVKEERRRVTMRMGSEERIFGRQLGMVSSVHVGRK